MMMFLPSALQKRGFCKIYLDIFHLLPNYSSLLLTLLIIFFSESLSSCSLIFHPGDSLCCSKWFTSLISPLLVTLTLFLSCLSHPPSMYLSPSLSHSVPVSLALNQSVSLSLWRLGNIFLFQTARSDLLPGSGSGGWLQLCTPASCRTDGSAFQELSDNGWRRGCACYVKRQCRCCTPIQNSCKM